MSRDRMCIIVCFCSWFYAPDSSDGFIREDNTIISIQEFSRSKKSPFHNEKSEHSLPKSWIHLVYLSCESHRSSIITTCRPYSRRNISIECFCYFDIESFCSASHEECIVIEKGFWHGLIIFIFIWIPRGNRYSNNSSQCFILYLNFYVKKSNLLKTQKKTNIRFPCAYCYR